MSLRGVRRGGRRGNPLAVINIKKGMRLLRSARNDIKTLRGYPVRHRRTSKGASPLIPLVHKTVYCPKKFHHADGMRRIAY